MCICVNTHHNLYPFLLYWSLIIGSITHSHQCVHVKPLQLLAGIKTEDFRHGKCKRTHTDNNTDRCGPTSVNLLSVALVGLWVMRNLMHS